MKRQRMRQTDTREDRLHQYWTVIKRETFSAVFKPSHPDISDTTPPPRRPLLQKKTTPNFSNIPWAADVQVRLACALLK